MCEFFRHVGAFLERAFKATSVRDGFCMAGVYPYSARQIMSTCRDGSWCQLDKTAFPGYELSEAEQKVLTAVDMAARKRLREGRGLPLDAELCEAAGLPLPRGDDSSLYLHRAALLNRSDARELMKRSMLTKEEKMEAKKQAAEKKAAAKRKKDASALAAKELALNACCCCPATYDTHDFRTQGAADQELWQSCEVCAPVRWFCQGCAPQVLHLHAAKHAPPHKRRK